MEWLKALSDRLIIWFLRVSSGFSEELTIDGKREQESWREQRLRNLRGLGLRSQERFRKKNNSSPSRD
jgi:hypothetical protein